MNKLRATRDNLMDRVPQEHKDRVNEQREKAGQQVDRAKQFLTEEYFPEERRDQFIYRGKKVRLAAYLRNNPSPYTNFQVIVECQKHKDYQESIRWLIDYLEEYAAHGRTVANHANDSHQQLKSDTSLQRATTELRTLLERFANGMSLSVIGDAMHDLYEDAQKDEDLRNWFKQCDAYIRRVSKAAVDFRQES